MIKPKLSIIIPCYNVAQYLPAALNSCLLQTYMDFELILVNDGSTDNTQEVINTYKDKDNRVVTIAHPNQGLQFTRNAGIHISKGDFLLFLDADDILLPRALEILTEPFSDPAVSITVGLHRQYDEATNLYQHRKNFYYPQHPLATLVRTWWPVSAYMVRKSNFLFNEGMKNWEVLEFLFQHFQEGALCKMISEEVTQINAYSGAQTHTMLHNHYDPMKCFSFFSEWKLLFKNKFPNDRLLGEAFDYQLLNFGYQYLREQKGQSLPKEWLGTIDRKALPQYDWYRLFSLSHVCNLLGIQKGMHWFYQLNAWIGRV